MVDPILVEVISGYLLSAAEEMTIAMVRSAYSPGVRERHDCSSAFLSPDGETIAQATDIPIHLGALMGIIGSIREYGVETLRDGDVVVANDPYQGSSTHLNDISVAAPIFLEGRLVAFAAVTAHHSDVGGASPGSESVDADSIFQEGLRLPCLMVHRDGAFIEETLRLVALNSRTPYERLGDLRAQVGSVIRGRQRFGELAAKYGRSAVEQAASASLDYTATRFRKRLLELPDGTFKAQEQLDPERSTGNPVEIHVEIEKKGDSLRLDFAGTSRQLREGRNVVWWGLLAATHYAVRALVDPEMPANSGFFRAVTVVAPRGCLVHASSPSPVSTRVSTCQHIAGVIFKAVAPAWEDRVIAGCDGRRKVIFSGWDPQKQRAFVYHESNAGGIGAHAHGDGLDGTCAHVIQILNMPVEALEMEYPLGVERLELIQNSGGAGRWRGGAGVRRDYVVSAGPVRCSLVSEKSNDVMWGLAGATSGAAGLFVVNPGRRNQLEIDSTRQSYVTLQTGQVLSVQTAGGGGFGDPGDRPLDDVLADVRQGRFSREFARKTYRVDACQDGPGEWAAERIRDSTDSRPD